MKNLPLICLLFIGLSISCIGQNKPDTMYVNARWKETSRDSATHYKIITKDSSLYRVEEHYIKGGLEMIAYYSSLNPEIEESHYTSYYENGNLNCEGEYRNNKPIGQWKIHYMSGQLWHTDNYKNGQYDGDLISYYRDGKLKRKEVYKDSVMIKGNCYKESGEDTVYYPFRIMPKFNGSIPEYLANETNYPAYEKKHNITGIVYVSFAVEKNGSVGDVTLLRGVSNGPGLNKEALRVISSMPKWSPGYQDGEPVRVQYNIPLSFTLN